MEGATEEVTEAEMIQAFIDAALSSLHVSMPARVESYDADKQTATVTPQLNEARPDGAGNFIHEKLPKLQDVPVKFQRCKQFTMTFPLVAGDFGLLVFAERSIGAWRKAAAQGDPGDLGMHTLDGAVFVPGLYPDKYAAQTADGTNMVVGSDTDGDSRIEFKPSGGINLGAGASKGVARDSDTVNMGSLTFAPGSGGAGLTWTDPDGVPHTVSLGGQPITGKISSSSAHIKAVD